MGGGKWEVIGGNKDDGDLGLYWKQDNGEAYKLGVTLTPTSFYDSDSPIDSQDSAWQGVIDMNDTSGYRFSVSVEKKDLFSYIKNARKGEKYDFKSEDKDHPYRGMKFETETGTVVITSARDIGNYYAGFISARRKIPYSIARLAFDSYQSIQSRGIEEEGESTQNAEHKGHLDGCAVNESSDANHGKKTWESIWMWFVYRF